MIPDCLTQELIEQGYGTPSDPMCVAVPFTQRHEFDEWRRQANVHGRWVRYIVGEALVYYVPDTAEYLHAKMRWS